MIQLCLCLLRSLSRVWLSATPWAAAHQASLSSSVSWSLLKFMSTESGRLSSHLILCSPLLLCFQSFPASESFPMSQTFTSRGQSVGAVKVKVKVLQSCPALCDPVNYTVYGILKARILEWGAFPPSSWDLPNPGIKPRSPTLWVDSLPDEPQGKPYLFIYLFFFGFFSHIGYYRI